MQNDIQKGMLGSRFENFNAAPSAGLWDAISSGLDEKKKRRGIIWWWLGSGIAAIGLIAASIYSDQTTHAELAKWNANQKLKIDQQHVHPNLSDSHSLLSADSSTDTSKSQFNSDDLETTDFQPNTPKDPQKFSGGANELQGSIGQQEEEQKVLKDVQARKEDVKKWKIAAPHLIALSDNETSLPRVDLTEKNDRFWEAGVAVSSWQAMGHVLFKDAAVSLLDTTSGLASDFEGESKFYKTNRPIGLTFHVGYHVNNRLRLVTGVSLESTQFKRVKNDAVLFDFFESSTGNFQSFSTYSIGIPLGVSYDFFKRNRLRFGAGLNFINEFVFAERIKPLHDANYVGPTNATTNFITGYNLGIHPNLHVSYHLSEKMKIMASPGMRWYPVSQVGTTHDFSQRKFYWGGSVGMIWEL